MTPQPEAKLADSMFMLRKRSEFLKAAASRRQSAHGFLLQGRHRGDGETEVRVGFTASKKIGNAVLRNRAKRRLRALAREVLTGVALHGWDYVLVARPEVTVTRPYAALRVDLITAVQSLHRGGKR